MCGPTLALDWLVLDVAYVLCLVGGTVVLRSRVAGVGTWLLFGILSVGVGGFLFGSTYFTQAAESELISQMNATAMLGEC